jgi:predicted nucleic acid-binding Zn finger protein
LKITDEFNLHQIEYGIDTGLQVLNIILTEQKGNMSETLFMYVGRNREYVNKVYERMGRFILFKSLKDTTQKTSLLSVEEPIIKPKVAPISTSIPKQ